MSTAAWLLAYAGILGWLLDPLLARSHWPCRHPGAGLWVWHGAALAVLTAIASALFLLAHDVAEHGFAWGLRADKGLVHAAYADPREVAAYWNVAIVPLLVGVAALITTTGRRIRSTRRESLAHRLAVEFKRPVPAVGGRQLLIGVQRSSVPAIYCVARGSGDERILATTGALQLLDDDQLRAAVAHERAHIVAHHHAMVTLSESVTSVSRWLGMLRHYQSSVRTLMELEADDTAAKHHGRRTVAAALLQMGVGAAAPAPGTGLPLGAEDVAARIRRLLHEDAPARGSMRSIAAGIAAALLALPLASFMVPALSVAGTAETDTVPGSPAQVPDFIHHP